MPFSFERSCPIGILEAERVFSEKTTPISELVEGNPDRPQREPALALVVCLFNVYQIYHLLIALPMLAAMDPMDPMFFWYSSMMLGVVTGLIGWYVAFCVILVIGAALIYFINRRVGGALILAISIIGILVSFVGVSFSYILTTNALSLIVGFLAPIIALIAGILGVRSERQPAQEMQEIV